jgi:hypothetical protein
MPKRRKRKPAVTLVSSVVVAAVLIGCDNFRQLEQLCNVMEVEAVRVHAWPPNVLGKLPEQPQVSQITQAGSTHQVVNHVPREQSGRRCGAVGQRPAGLPEPRNLENFPIDTLLTGACRWCRSLMVSSFAAGGKSVSSRAKLHDELRDCGSPSLGLPPGRVFVFGGQSKACDLCTSCRKLTCLRTPMHDRSSRRNSRIASTASTSRWALVRGPRRFGNTGLSTFNSVRIQRDGAKSRVVSRLVALLVAPAAPGRSSLIGKASWRPLVNVEGEVRPRAIAEPPEPCGTRACSGWRSGSSTRSSRP